MSLSYLKSQLARKQPRIKLRYDYYEMKDKHLPRNLFVPQEMAYKFSQQMGWCTKAVDSLADRLQFRGFRDDNYNLNSIYALNNADILYSSAILSALISSCSFIYISADIEGDPKFQVIDGYNATGIIDDTTGMLKEGYAILDRDEFGYPILEAYFESGKTTFFNKYLVDEFIKKNKKFILLYRYNDEISNIANKFFTDIHSLFFNDYHMTECKESKLFMRLFLNDVECGYAISLNSAEKLKKFSHIFSDVEYILFDEFQSENNNYTSNEITKFMSIIFCPLYRNSLS